MKNRNGEKIGWIGGWLGGFLWVFILGVVFLVQHQWEKGIIGLGLFGLAVFFVLFFAPWKLPGTPYWTLMLPLYFLFFSTAGWGIWAFSGWKAAGLDWWQLSWVLPMLLPLFTAGRRAWNDGLSGSNNQEPGE